MLHIIVSIFFNHGVTKLAIILYWIKEYTDDNGLFIETAYNNTTHVFLDDLWYTGGYKKSMNFEEVLVTVGEFCKALGDENYLSIDPMFTDPENGDLTLKESGPAKDAGTMGLDLGISPV